MQPVAALRLITGHQWLAEARKLSVSVCSANQYLEQYPPSMRAAILSIGSQIFFQLGSADAGRISSYLSSGKHMRKLLLNLPHRELILKSGTGRPRHIRVPDLPLPLAPHDGLRSRSNARFARLRAAVEREIELRQATTGGLDAWE